MNRRLAELEDRVAEDLRRIRYPDREWVLPRVHPAGHHVHDVVIVGAGHCGLTVAFALQRKCVTNVVLLEAAEAGRQGPWTTYGRMHTLRSPKHFNGPDLDIPSLTCESWYRARYGDQAWDQIAKLPRQAWQEYLLWFREVLNVPVRYETRVHDVRPAAEGILELRVGDTDAPDSVYARKVVFATGAEGGGGWFVPSVVADNLPKRYYAQAAEDIDFASLRGKVIAVLGGGASAYDNAAVALEAGAAEAHLFFRRAALHRVNPHKWTEFSGFLEAMRDLDDAWRWRFMSHIIPLNEPPPPETFIRASSRDGFFLHLGVPWESAAVDGDRVVISSPQGQLVFDYVIVATGIVTDLSLRSELSTLEPHIALWSDRYTPPVAERNDDLGRCPYLGPHFEYVERRAGTAPHLRDIYNFTAAATLSHGPSGASINGMKQAVRRMVHGICRDFFVRDADRYYEQLRRFATPELDVPWPLDSGDQQDGRAPMPSGVSALVPQKAPN